MRLERRDGCLREHCPLHPPGWRLEGGMSSATQRRLMVDPVGNARYRAAEFEHVVTDAMLGMEDEMRGKTQRRPKYDLSPMVDMHVLERLMRPRQPLTTTPPVKGSETTLNVPSYVHKAADWYRLGGAFVPQVDGGAIVYNPRPGLHEIATGIKLTEPDRMTFERLLTTASIYRPTNPTESAPGGVVANSAPLKRAAGLSGVVAPSRTYAEPMGIGTDYRGRVENDFKSPEEKSVGELKAFPSTAARNTYDDTVVRDIMRKNGGRISYAAFNEAIKAAGLSLYRGSLARHRLDIKTQNFPSYFDGAPIVMYTDAFGRSAEGLRQARVKAAGEAKSKTLYVAVVDNGIDINGEPDVSGLAQRQFASFIGTDKAKVTQQALDAARELDRTTLKSYVAPARYVVHVGVLTEEAVEPKPQPKWETISLRTGLKTGGVL